MSKFKSFMDRLKKNILLYLIVWLVMVILFVAPMTYIATETYSTGGNIIQEMLQGYIDAFLKFPITFIFDEKYIGDFIKGVEYFSIFYVIVVFWSIYKTLPKSAYYNIEHGSSDWCLPGEQYRILSKKKGLILAKDNYLPVDKIGNVNVLIVGRIWCW